MNSVCIVGNGPSVVNVPLGRQIDAHETVVRINNYRLLSRETTGLHTDVWATTERMSKARAIQCTVRRLLYITSTPMVADWVLLPDERFQATGYAVWKEMLQRHNAIKPGGHPTSGLLVIRYFLQTEQQVTVHGYDGMVGQQWYWNQERQLPEDAHKHWPEAEQQIMQEWIEEGRVSRLEVKNAVCE